MKPSYYKQLFLLLIASFYLVSSVFAQDSETQSSPQPPQFGLSPDKIVDMGNSVNLFTGEVALPINLVSLPSSNAPSVNIAISYSSIGVKKQVETKNIESPTGILGLGWSMDFPKIIVNNMGTGARDDDEFFLSEGGTNVRLLATNLGVSGEIKFELEKYSNWKISYYESLEKWVILKDDGTTFIYGDNLSGRQTIQNIVRWGNWIGASSKIYNSTGVAQQQQAAVWNLSEVINSFGNKVTYSYENVEENIAGSSGKAYTKASYLKTITDSFGRTVTFFYQEKTPGGVTYLDSYNREQFYAGLVSQEFQDPHIEGHEPDAYQEQVETRYLSSIEVKSENQKVLGKFEFQYELLNATQAGFTKRLLKSISQINGEGEGIITKFNYETTIGNLALGKLKEVEVATGAKIRYTYDSGIIIPFSDREKRVFRPTPPNESYAFAEPEVLVGSDYVVVTWRHVDSNAKPLTGYADVIVEVYTWEGEWIKQELGRIHNVALTNGTNSKNQPVPRHRKKWQIKLEKDFFVIINSNDPNKTESNHLYQLHIYKKDNTKRGVWFKQDDTFLAGFNHNDEEDSSNENPILITGKDYVAVQQSGLGTLITAIQEGNHWRVSSMSQGGGKYFATGTNNFILTHNMNRNDDGVIFHHLDKFKEWKSKDLMYYNGPKFNVGSDRNYWAATNSYAIGVLSGVSEYIYQWSIDYNSFQYTQVYNVNSDDIRNLAIRNELVGIYEGDNGLMKSHNLRFNGVTWDSYGSGWYASGKTSYGTDRILWITTAPSAHILDYSANEFMWKTSPALTVSGYSTPSMNVNSLIYSNNYYEQNIRGLVDYKGNLHNTNISYIREFGVNKTLYSIGTNDIKISGLTNGILFHRTLVSRHIIRDIDFESNTLSPYYFKSDISIGNSSGNDIIVNSGDFSAGNWQRATEFYLNKFVGNDLQYAMVAYPVKTVEVFDGFTWRSTDYAYEGRTATMDASGVTTKYNKVIVTNGINNGWTENYFFNGRIEENLTAIDASNTIPYYVLAKKPDPRHKDLLGSTYRTKVFDKNGSLVNQISIAFVTGSSPIRSAIREIGQASYARIDASQQESNGIVTKTQYIYTIDNRLASIETYNVNGLESTKVIYTYGDDVYPGLLAQNIRNSIVKTEKYSGTDISDVSVTTYKDWGGGKYAPLATYTWKGFPGSFIFDYTSSNQPSEFLKTSEVLTRDAKGNITSSRGLDNIENTRVYGFGGNLALGSFRNALPSEVFVEDFNDAFPATSNSNNWNYTVPSNKWQRTSRGTLGFDPSNSYPILATSSSALSGNNFIIEFDLRLTSTTTPGVALFQFNKNSLSATQTSSGISLEYRPGSITLVQATGGNTVVLSKDANGYSGPIAISPTTQWRRFRLVRQGYSLKLYMNGEFLQQVTILANNYDIGQYFGFFGHSFNTAGVQAEADNIRIYPADAEASTVAYEPDFKTVEVSHGPEGLASRQLYDQFNQGIVAVKGINTPVSTVAGNTSARRDASGNFNPNDPTLSLSTSIRGKEGIYDDFSSGANNWVFTASTDPNGYGPVANFTQSNGKLVIKNITNPNGIGSWLVPSYSLNLGKLYTGRVGVEFSIRLNGTGSSDWDIIFGAGGANWDASSASNAAECAIWTTFNTANGFRTHSGGYWGPIATQPLVAGTTYRLKILINTQTQLADYYLDGKLVRVNVNFRTAYPAIAGIQKIAFATYGRAGQTEWHVDNVVVYSDPMHGVTYSDALGKMLQVQQEQPNDKILVSETVYDDLGRGAVQTLPTLVSSRFGYQPNFVTSFDWSTSGASTGISGDVKTINNNDAFAFTRSVYEASPLSRVVETSQLGYDFRIGGGHTSKIEYGNNTTIPLAAQGFTALPANSHSVEKLTNTDGKISYVVKDWLGKTVYKKGQVNANTDAKTSYLYDIYGNLTEIRPPNYYSPPGSTQAAGYKTTIAYDHFGRVVSKADPDAGTSRYIYDNLGRLRFMQDANAMANASGVVLYFDYDVLGRKTEEGFISGRTWDTNTLNNYLVPNFTSNYTGGGTLIWRKRFVYGNHPNLAGSTVFDNNALVKIEVNNDDAADIEVEETFATDSEGNLKTKGVLAHDYASTATNVTYTYNNQGAVTTMNYGDIGTVTYSQDISGRTSMVGLGSDPTFFANYTYNKNGAMATENLRNFSSTNPLITRNFSYDQQGRLSGLENQWNQPTGLVGQFVEYLAFNNAGNISNATYGFSWPGAPDGYEVNYEYDYLGQLTSASNSLGEDFNFSASYDPNGNFLVRQDMGSRELPSGYKEYVYNVNRVINTRNDASAKDYEYDANGNVISSAPKGIANLVYDPFTNLTTFAGGAVNHTTFQYGSNNQRVVKYWANFIPNSDGSIPFFPTSTTWTYYIHGANDYPLIEIEGGSHQVEEFPREPIKKHYVYGPTGLIAVLQNGRWEMPIKDHLGSTRVLVSEQGFEVASYDYMPFGELMRSTVSSEVKYQYTGQEKDSELGLENYRARMYDADLGRFYAADPAEQFHYAYGYAANNPVQYTDPDGEIVPFIIAGAVIGAYIGGSIAEKNLNPFSWEWDKNTRKGVIIGAVAGALIGTGVGIYATAPAAMTPYTMTPALAGGYGPVGNGIAVAKGASVAGTGSVGAAGTGSLGTLAAAGAITIPASVWAAAAGPPTATGPAALPLLAGGPAGVLAFGAITVGTAGYMYANNPAFRSTVNDFLAYSNPAILITHVLTKYPSEYFGNLHNYTPPPRDLPGFPGAVRVPSKGRARWKSPDGRILEWDSQHGDVEVYDKNGNHLGSADPNTGEYTKPKVKGRTTRR